MKPIPLIHTSDLVHPPWDVDDQWDIALAYAFDEFDLKAVILDSHIDYDKRTNSEPAFGLVSQLNWMTGRSVPAAVGPNTKLKSPDDDGRHYDRINQAGIDLLIRSLRLAESPAIITVTGSCRTVAAARNREPELFRRKVKMIIALAGSVLDHHSPSSETNVRFDPHAFVSLMRSDVPIWWFPCYAWQSGRTTPGPDWGPDWEMQREQALRHSSMFFSPHAELLGRLPRKLHNWFMHGLTGNLRGDIIRALYDDYHCTWWGVVSQVAHRMVASPAFFALAAGRVAVRDERGWRFARPEEAGTGQRYPMTLIGVDVTVDSDGRTQWRPNPSGRVKLFEHTSDRELYRQVMTQAVNRILREEFPLRPEDLADCVAPPGVYDGDYGYRQVSL